MYFNSKTSHGKKRQYEAISHSIVEKNIFREIKKHFFGANSLY
jgi:hypothetical protein